MQTDFFEQFMAKSDGITTLPMHTNHVIIAGKNLIEQLPLSSEEKKYWNEKLFRCAVLHDLGKIHSAFQRRLKGDKNIDIRHEIVSLWFCENFLELERDELFAIATHHKGIIKDTAEGSSHLNIDSLKDHMREHSRQDYLLLTETTLKEWLKIMHLNLPTINKEIQPEISKESIKTLHFLHQSRIILNDADRKQLSFTRALLIAADHIGSARMENEIPTYRKLCLSDFQPRDKNQKAIPLRGFQERLLDIKTDIVLHAPTGSGKTEAALSWIYANQTENARLFYLLPYTASINAMVKRLKLIYENDKIERVTALHSKTLDFFYDQLANEESNEEKIEIEKDFEKIEQKARSKKSLSRELFYPIKVATLHQILKVSLKGKGWELALYDYKNALFVVDEFHTYDALLTGMLLASIKLFRKLFNAKFLFMSATIPDFMLNHIINQVFDGDHKKIIRPSPESDSDKEILNSKRHKFFCQPNKSLSDSLNEIIDYLTRGKSVLVILNNVKSAQYIYDNIHFDGSAELLHSGFHKKDRNRIEKTITHENHDNRPQLLIATQAVEVSLDIDYDMAFIENAPIDALIQRLGRVNRAGKKQIASILLFEKIMGRTPFYDKEVINDTWELLLKLDQQELSENDLVNVCNQVYANGYNENQQKDFQQGLSNSTINNFETDWTAGDWNNWIEDIMENNMQKVEILCRNLIEEYDELRNQKRYIEAAQLLVSVYFYELNGTNHRKDIKRNVIVGNDFEYGKLGYLKKKEFVEDRIW